MDDLVRTGPATYSIREPVSGEMTGSRIQLALDDAWSAEGEHGYTFDFPAGVIQLDLGGPPLTAEHDSVTWRFPGETRFQPRGIVGFRSQRLARELGDIAWMPRTKSLTIVESDGHAWGEEPGQADSVYYFPACLIQIGRSNGPNGKTSGRRFRMEGNLAHVWVPPEMQWGRRAWPWTVLRVVVGGADVSGFSCLRARSHPFDMGVVMVSANRSFDHGSSVIAEGFSMTRNGVDVHQRVLAGGQEIGAEMVCLQNAGRLSHRGGTGTSRAYIVGGEGCVIGDPRHGEDSRQLVWFPRGARNSHIHGPYAEQSCDGRAPSSRPWIEVDPIPDNRQDSLSISDQHVYLAPGTVPLKYHPKCIVNASNVYRR